MASVETLLLSNRIMDFPDHHMPFAYQTVGRFYCSRALPQHWGERLWETRVEWADRWGSRQALLGGERNKVQSAFSRASPRRQTPWASLVPRKLSDSTS